MSDKPSYIQTRFHFIACLVIICITILLVYIFGDKKLYHNALSVVSILAVLCFVYLALSLYYGVKIINAEDTFFPIRGFKTNTYLKNLDTSGFEIGDAGSDDGCIGAIFAIIIWIVISVFLLIFLAFLVEFVWIFGLTLIAVLYWVYLRALHLISNLSPICQGNSTKSIAYAFLYTILYAGWIYAIIFIGHYAGH